MLVRHATFFCVFHLLVIAAVASEPTIDRVSEAVAIIQKVGPNGAGHETAVAAMKVLNAATPDQIPLILEGMNDNNKLAANWLRAAVTKIAGGQQQVPLVKIRSYFDDRSRSHMGRLLAFELLTEQNEKLKQQLIPTLIDDPSLPLRYKAVAHMIEESETADAVQSVGMLGIALDKARNVDQVVAIAKALDKKGVAVDLQKQLGFINNWHWVGRFDNSSEKGFDTVYGPEKSLAEIKLEAVYDDCNAGSDGKWQSYNTVDTQGLVDLNDVVGKIKDVIVYAHATFDSDADQTADIRIGCINAHKVWVNGELVMANEIYHNGISPDKFIGKTMLKKGSNDILVKVCQNNQSEPWAQRWQFQLRVCDETGKAFSIESDSSTEE